MKKDNSLKRNNNGLSLIEIIIVIAIMSIIGGAVLLTTAIATDKHVTSCGEKVVSSLEQTRNLAMGKQSGYIEIWKDAGGYMFCQMTIDGQAGDEIAIGHSGLTVEITEEGATPYNLDGHGRVKIEFSRSNGSVISSPSVKEIKVTNSRRTVIITIDKFTGRVSGEKV